MRQKIIDSIFDHMSADENLFFLTADMGINLVEKIGESFPNRFLNVGIAEQNLIGVSAGLVNTGYRPFTYTISNFAIHRCLEQIRNDIVLHNYPVTILGTSTGYDNAPLGPTHHIIDEWGVLNAIPQIDIYCPSTAAYANRLVEYILEANRPAYVRIPKGDFSFPCSDEHLVKLQGDENEILLVSYGAPSQACIEVQKIDPRVSVLVVNRLRPLDKSVLAKALAPHSRIYVVEDHFPASGLYGSLCQFTLENACPAKLISLAPQNYEFVVGKSADYFHQHYGIDVAGIIKSIGNNL